MIIRAEDRKQTLTPNARGGDGTLDKRDYVLENMPENAKMFAEIKLEPGCSLYVLHDELLPASEGHRLHALLRQHR